MKICVSSKSGSLDSEMDPRFGRAAWFILVDTDTMETEMIENTAASTSGGAGITSGQQMVDKGVEAVVTGNLGPNAMNVLNAAEIKAYHGMDASVRDNIEAFRKGVLSPITRTVPSHFGMNAK